MDIVQYVLDPLCFILEIAAFAAFGYWGFRLKANLPVRISLGLGTPIAVIYMWGTFLSPRASIPPPLWASIILQLAVFALAALSLYARRRRTLAILLLSIAYCTTLLVYSLQ
ncbi:YrdB family protein [Paenibacillus kobensis]|uniref:YrdB family protein n=1 Tax=Paenibacillus kobensis TaxID=59841 RepID=UPI000FD99EA8|nr:YrdB family protein [Paenibacillus kobensis]